MHLLCGRISLQTAIYTYVASELASHNPVSYLLFKDEPLSSETVITFGQIASPPKHPQQPEVGVRMRQSKGWYEETDDEGNSYYTHPDSKDQVMAID